MNFLTRTLVRTQTLKERKVMVLLRR
ncbi:unnamed protein product, partial [Vitis vinifera]